MRTSAWVKSIVSFAVIMVGGPALINYVTPTEEELFKKYNPELQKRSLEGRDQRLKDANDFVDKIKEFSKSDKPIWTVWKEAEMADKKKRMADEKTARDQRKSIAEELKRQRLEGDDR